MQNYGWGAPETIEQDSSSGSMQCDNIFGVDPFYVERGNYVMQHALTMFYCFEKVTRRHCKELFSSLTFRGIVL